MAYRRNLQPVRPAHAQCRHREDVVIVDFSIDFSSSVNLPRRERNISLFCFSGGMLAFSSKESIWEDFSTISFRMFRIATGLSIVPQRQAFSHGALHVSQGICGRLKAFNISLYASGSCPVS